MFLISLDMAPRASQPVAGPFRCVPDIVCGRTKCAAKGRIRSDTYTGGGLAQRVTVGGLRPDFRKASAPPSRTPLQREAAAETKLNSDEVAALPLIASAVDAILSDCCGNVAGVFHG
jgi:hypothetical protein